MSANPLPEEAYVVQAIVLIERDAIVPVKMRTLATLASYALANPTDDLGKRLRDEALDELHRAYVAAFDALVAES